MSEVTRTVTDADFDQLVIEGSRQTPVVVDFWAPWCGPCRALTPVLEKLAQEYEGKFVLAKVNADDNPALSQRYAIRSIPCVMAFVDAEQVDQFLGVQPESAVRAFLDRLLPSPAELLRREAEKQTAQGNAEGALKLLNEAASSEPNNERVLADLVGTLLDLNRINDAHETAEKLLPLRVRQPRTAQALARLELAADSSTEDAVTLEARIAQTPTDTNARLALAKLHAKRADYEAAFDQLLEILKRDRAAGETARKTMLALFEMLGSDHPLVRRYRKELAAALY